MFPIPVGPPGGDLFLLFRGGGAGSVDSGCSSFSSSNNPSASASSLSPSSTGGGPSRHLPFPWCLCRHVRHRGHVLAPSNLFFRTCAWLSGTCCPYFSSMALTMSLVFVARSTTMSSTHVSTFCGSTSKKEDNSPGTAFLKNPILQTSDLLTRV